MSDKTNNRFYREKPKLDLSTMVYGKIPPQAIEPEKVVLGAIMIEKGALAEIQDILTDTKFYVTGHQVIFRAILNLDAKSQRIDTITVVEELKVMGKLEEVGGAYYITMLTRDVVSSANIVTHAMIIAQKWMAREVIRVGGEMVGGGYDDEVDPFDLLDEAERSIAGIMDSNDRGKIVPVDAAMARGLQRIAMLRQQDNDITGIPSGFDALDKITHGWQDTDLIILAARPAVGKTAFALNLVRNAVMRKTPAAFFSLEMSESQLVERLISAESGIYLDQIKTGRLDDEQMRAIHAAAGRIAQAPLFLDDTPALNIFELRAKCRRLRNKHKIGFIIVDYLQLMAGASKKGNREQEVSEISRGLKGLAKELGVPIIALSQLSRGVEDRQVKTPELRDLRESGAIEQDADMVMFLYRPEYYGEMANSEGESTRGETHVKIAKHRNGSLDTVKLTAKLETQLFVNFQGGAFTLPPSNFRPVRMPYNDDKTPF